MKVLETSKRLYPYTRATSVSLVLVGLWGTLWDDALAQRYFGGYRGYDPGYVIHSPEGSSFAVPNGAGGYTIQSRGRTSYAAPDGLGGYTVFSPHGITSVLPGSAGGYTILSPRGNSPAYPGGQGIYRIPAPGIFPPR